MLFLFFYYKSDIFAISSKRNIETTFEQPCPFEEGERKIPWKNGFRTVRRSSTMSLNQQDATDHFFFVRPMLERRSSTITPLVLVFYVLDFCFYSKRKIYVHLVKTVNFEQNLIRTSSNYSNV